MRITALLERLQLLVREWQGRKVEIGHQLVNKYLGGKQFAGNACLDPGYADQPGQWCGEICGNADQRERLIPRRDEPETLVNNKYQARPLPRTPAHPCCSCSVSAESPGPYRRSLKAAP